MKFPNNDFGKSKPIVVKEKNKKIDLSDYSEDIIDLYVNQGKSLSYIGYIEYDVSPQVIKRVLLSNNINIRKR